MIQYGGFALTGMEDDFPLYNSVLRADYLLESVILRQSALLPAALSAGR